ncbi:unnamed protein product [Nezara viridula]|uniref:Uncharacterized protein n=1 Tax=Nezara viridula TaxID=85310 RepID=A0A9P0HCH4_NEZVI|nr:unnamed protein product [Nezara viridula]
MARGANPPNTTIDQLHNTVPLERASPKGISVRASTSKGWRISNLVVCFIGVFYFLDHHLRGSFYVLLAPTSYVPWLNSSILLPRASASPDCSDPLF